MAHPLRNTKTMIQSISKMEASAKKCLQKGDWDLLCLGLLTLRLDGTLQVQQGLVEHHAYNHHHHQYNNNNKKIYQQQVSLRNNIGKHDGIDIVTMLRFISLSYTKQHATTENKLKHKLSQIYQNPPDNNIPLLQQFNYSKNNTKSQQQQQWELVACDFTSGAVELARPAHFLAIRKLQNDNKRTQIVLSIRGTVSSTDVMTCLLAEAIDYRGGKVHKGAHESGMWLTEKYKDLLCQICDEALPSSNNEEERPPRVELTIVGHSLGAGAACVAGIELNDILKTRGYPCSIEVVGFGCLGVFSQSLSKDVSSLITTIVAGDDMIPCASPATIRNMFANVGNYAKKRNNKKKGKKNHDDAGEESSSSSEEEEEEKATTWNPLLHHMQTRLMEKVNEIPPETNVELYPAGTCIHLKNNKFYGACAWRVPCTNFSEIKVGPNMVQDHDVRSGYIPMVLKVIQGEEEEDEDEAEMYWSNAL